jgi:hypothetical protein
MRNINTSNQLANVLQVDAGSQKISKDPATVIESNKRTGVVTLEKNHKEFISYYTFPSTHMSNNSSFHTFLFYLSVQLYC